MAKHKSKSPSGASQEKSLRAALKFAKARGLFKGDLRKPMNAYRRKLALSFGDTWKSPELFQSVKVGKGASAVTGDFVVAHGNGRVLVEKPRASDRYAYSKKKKQITMTSTNARTGKKTKSIVTVVGDKPGLYGVPMWRGKAGMEYQWFDSAQAAVALIMEYEKRRMLGKDQSTIQKSINDWIAEIEYKPYPRD